MAKSKKSKKPTLVKKPYTLIEDVMVGDKLYKKGSQIKLTEEGLRYLKTINKIEKWQH